MDKVLLAIALIALITVMPFAVLFWMFSLTQGYYLVGLMIGLTVVCDRVYNDIFWGDFRRGKYAR